MNHDDQPDKCYGLTLLHAIVRVGRKGGEGGFSSTQGSAP